MVRDDSDIGPEACYDKWMLVIFGPESTCGNDSMLLIQVKKNNKVTKMFSILNSCMLTQLSCSSFEIVMLFDKVLLHSNIVQTQDIHKVLVLIFWMKIGIVIQNMSAIPNRITIIAVFLIWTRNLFSSFPSCSIGHFSILIHMMVIKQIK